MQCNSGVDNPLPDAVTDIMASTHTSTSSSPSSSSSSTTTTTTAAAADTNTTTTTTATAAATTTNTATAAADDTNTATATTTSTAAKRKASLRLSKCAKTKSFHLDDEVVEILVINDDDDTCVTDTSVKPITRYQRHVPLPIDNRTTNKPLHQLSRELIDLVLDVFDELELPEWLQLLFYNYFFGIDIRDPTTQYIFTVAVEPNKGLGLFSHVHNQCIPRGNINIYIYMYVRKRTR